MIVFAFLFLFIQPVVSDIKKDKKMEIKISSSAFSEGGMILKQFTCDGKDVSPQLSWSGIPNETKSIAILCDDPDAPVGDWVHWIIFNLPPDITSLPENVPNQKVLQNGAKQGINDFRKIGYGGPCPPALHRYFFKIFALDIVLTNDAGIIKAQLLKAMEGHILAKGQLMGKYKR